MSDEILRCYQQELHYLRQLLQEYSAIYPKLGQGLNLDSKGFSTDPSCERLIQSAAWLNASSLNAIHDNFSELSHDILATQAPHFISPIPSCSIVKFTPNHNYVEKKLWIPRHSLLEITDYPLPVFFKTIYPVELLAIEISNVQLVPQPFIFSNNSSLSEAESGIKAVLRISLKPLLSQYIWKNSGINSLVFYINAAAPDNYKLYDVLMQSVQNIAIANDISDPYPVVLKKTSLEAVGFSAEELLLEYAKTVKPGYKILNDYAVFPEKFLFFRINNLEEALREKPINPGHDLELLIFLNEAALHLASIINKDSLELNCTPVINIFPKKASINGEEKFSPELCLSTLNAHKNNLEIYGLEKVIGYYQDKKPIEILSYHSSQHLLIPQIYYYSRRVPAYQAGYYQADKTALLLSFVDDKKTRQTMQGWTFDLDLQCYNGDLPSYLPWKELRLNLLDQKQEALAAIRVLRKFTVCSHPLVSEKSSWQFIAHLQANPLAVTAQPSIKTLQSIVDIYDCSVVQQVMKSGVNNVQYQQRLKHHPQAKQGAPPFWHGAEITLQVATREFNDTSLFLFANIMAEFFPVFVAKEFFTQIKIITEHGQYNYLPERPGQL